MWYIQKKGRAEGPLPEATIAHSIRKGELGPFDLVFRDGESRWQVLSEIPEFKDCFEKNPPTTKAEEDVWVVLVKRAGSKSRQQKGPYTTTQIREMLKSGQIVLTDYVWKEGMKEWYRLHSLELFHKLDSNSPTITMTMTMAEMPAVPAKGEELLKNVKVMERAKLPPPDPVPLEATLVDLKPEKRDKPKKSSSSKRKVKKREDTAVTQVRRLSWFDRVREFPWPKKNIQRFTLAGGAALVLLGVLYFLTYHDWQSLIEKEKVTAKAKPKPKPVVKAEAAPPAPIVAKAPEPVATPQATPTPEPEQPAKPPGYLRLKLLNAGSSNAILDIQTDASKHFSVQLRIAGEAGRVLGFKSYYKEQRIRGIEDRKVKLESLNLPPGYFVVSAQIGDFQESAVISWKTTDKTFRQGFSEHRKSIVHYATMERYYWFKSAEYLEAKAIEFNGRLKSSPKNLGGYYRDWSRSLNKTPGAYLKAITAGNRQNYVYAAEWLRLRELQKNLSSTAKQLASVKDPTNKAALEAAATLKEITADLGRQKEAALQASLWR